MSRLVQFDQLRNTRDLGGMVTMEGHRITEEHGICRRRESGLSMVYLLLQERNRNELYIIDIMREGSEHGFGSGPERSRKAG